ncbi:MAG TPA: SMP-30/gluconolactonase/LRE family protein [Mucilaginibacter sp.]|jgi:gluconolactonase|nr:SMP-30/gluconolactonase/LRE family protein [Mucilaginibacter sp.]
MKYLIAAFAAVICLSCNKPQRLPYTTFGEIDRIGTALDTVIDPKAKIEIIAEGFTWSEGPVWVQKENMLLFSDITTNTIYKWTEEKGREPYLTPSGYTDTVKRDGEKGANGLLLDNNGNLVICQQGDRQIARMNSSLTDPKPQFIPLAKVYQGKRLNSPNDAAYNHDGELFFTDPPYGFEGQDDDPKKEQHCNGVYKVKKNGDVILLIDTLTRPNGIAFMPGDKQLIVSNSDPKKAYWYIYDVVGDSLKNARVFYSIGAITKKMKGVPDGLKIDKHGNVFATGPNGVWIFNSKGKLLGNIKVPEFTSNIALSADEKTMYITADMYVLRVKMRD